MKVRKTYNLLWSTAILQLLAGFVINSSSSFSIDATYLIADYSILSMKIALWLFIVGFLYWIINKANYPFNKSFNQFHLFVTIGSCIFFWSIFLVLKLTCDNDFFEEFGTFEEITLVILFLNIIIQSIFIINFLFNSINKIKSSS